MKGNKPELLISCTEISGNLTLSPNSTLSIWFQLINRIQYKEHFIVFVYETFEGKVTRVLGNNCKPCTVSIKHTKHWGEWVLIILVIIQYSYKTEYAFTMHGQVLLLICLKIYFKSQWNLQKKIVHHRVYIWFKNVNRKVKLFSKQFLIKRCHFIKFFIFISSLFFLL